MKLVAEVGVGTIAAGVAKAHADVVLISGYDGGTGASPQTSIKHAGLPWELGLAETHQTLVLNNLRSRIAVETDGQLKTGPRRRRRRAARRRGVRLRHRAARGDGLHHDARLPSEHLPGRRRDAGSAPAREVRRQARARRQLHALHRQEVREIMAQLGFRTHRGNGRPRRPARSRARPIDHWKAKGLDFSNLLYQPDVGPDVGRFCQIAQDHGLEKSLDLTQLLDLCKPAIERGERVIAELPIRNVNRVVGTITGSEITRKYGADGPAGGHDPAFTSTARPARASARSCRAA